MTPKGDSGLGKGISLEALSQDSQELLSGTCIWQASLSRTPPPCSVYVYSLDGRGFSVFLC